MKPVIALVVGWIVLLLAALAILDDAPASSSAASSSSPPCVDECAERVQRRQARHRYEQRWATAPAWIRAHLRTIARCESRGNERAVSADGLYRGLLQFWPPTWRSVGGRGDPAAASRIEQWARGVTLYKRAGWHPWPVCGRPRS